MAMTAHLAPNVVVDSLGGGIPPAAAATAVQSPETLSEAIDYLDHHGGGEITFASSLSGQIIEPTHVLPTIDEPITIRGLGQNRLGVSGRAVTAKSGWMVTIASGIAGGVTIEDMTFSSRVASGGGGAIDAASPLTLRHVEMRGNVDGAGDGAGVYTTSPLTVEHSVISYNTASGDGGAIFAKNSDVNVSHSTFINDSAVHGAAIADVGGNELKLHRTTFTADFDSAAGGAIYAAGSGPSSLINVDVTESSIAHNGGGSYGGVIDAKDAAVTITASTIFKNHAHHGRGIAQTGSGSLTLRNTILADFGLRSSDPRELDLGSGVALSSTFSLVANATGSGIAAGDGNILGTLQHPVNPLLRRLGYHGGRTMTMPLRPGSPAIDQGKAFGLRRDQRGAKRTVWLGRPLPSGGDGTDIGAFEQHKPRVALRRHQATFGDQRARLWVPSGYSCPAPGEKFTVRFSSHQIRRPNAPQLGFKHAALWIGHGVRRVRKRGNPPQLVVVHRPNARSRQDHAAWRLEIRHARHLGYRKVRLVLRYREHYIDAGRSRTRTVTRTLRTRLNLC